MGRKGKEKNEQLCPSPPAQRSRGEREEAGEEPQSPSPHAGDGRAGGCCPSATPPGHVEGRLQPCPSQGAGPPPADRDRASPSPVPGNRGSPVPVPGVRASPAPGPHLPQPGAGATAARAAGLPGATGPFFFSMNAPPRPPRPRYICIMTAAGDGIGCWRAGSGVMSALAG